MAAILTGEGHVHVHTQIGRTARRLLSELTLTNFDKTSADIAALEITEPGQLQDLAGIVFDKSLNEPHFAKMYARLCSDIKEKLPAFDVEVPPHCRMPGASP
jgi:hypothetical protein